MFDFIRESKNKFYDDEAIDGLKNFFFLVGILAVSGIFMAGFAFWLSHK